MTTFTNLTKHSTTLTNLDKSDITFLLLEDSLGILFEDGCKIVLDSSGVQFTNLTKH